MKQPNSAALKRSPEPVSDLYQDETLAMVYVGDVYSLVAQGDTVNKTESSTTESDAEQQSNDTRDDNDTLLPFIR